MPVATGVVSDTHGAAAVTPLPMPAEDGGAAGHDRPERRVLDLREPVRTPIRIPMGAHNVRKLKPTAGVRDRRAHGHGAHGSTLRRLSESVEQIERGAWPDLRVPCQLEVPRGGTQMPVAEQALNGVQIRSGFE